MSHISTGVEYGLHCLLFLVDGSEGETAPSARDLADLQGVPPEYVAKIFTKLQKAGLVTAREGLRGGMKLARPAKEITVLDVVTAIDGDKNLFECREVRGRCAVLQGKAVDRARDEVCSIHAVMLEAEARMRDVLGRHTLADIAKRVSAKMPNLNSDVSDWLSDRANARHLGTETR